MSSNYLGTGEVTVNQVNLNALSASQALWRLRELNHMFNMANLEKKPEDLLKIALYALKGDKESKDLFDPIKCYNVDIQNVDIDELNQEGLKDRYEQIGVSLRIVSGIYSFLEIARLALTGVPF